MAEAMERMSALSIAAIKGPCVGGGVVLAGVCDLRVAADDTVFSIPEVDLGIPLAWGGIPRLVREIGPAFTRELVLTCRPFGPDEAKALGFVNRVVPRAELESAVDELAEQLARKAPGVVRATKRQVNEALEDVAPPWEHGRTPTCSVPQCVTPKPVEPPASTSPRANADPLTAAPHSRFAVTERLGRANRNVTQTAERDEGGIR